eukprot:4453105-Amphidinium_carterae.1
MSNLQCNQSARVVVDIFLLSRLSFRTCSRVSVIRPSSCRASCGDVDGRGICLVGSGGVARPFLSSVFSSSINHVDTCNRSCRLVSCFLLSLFSVVASTLLLSSCPKVVVVAVVVVVDVAVAVA